MNDLPSILQTGRELAAKATALPWEFRATKDSGGIQYVVAPHAEPTAQGFEFIPADCSHGYNGEYIAFACSHFLTLAAEIERLRAQINEPLTADFIEAVRIEAAHQRERWGNEHDAGKTDADWFWLIGYLAGKALHNPGDGREKQLHRIITIGAAAANWHLAKHGATNMRPGIAEPQG